MRHSYLSFALVILSASLLSGCGLGIRDSLLLTGLRDKPDESRIELHGALELPENDRVAAPGNLRSRLSNRPLDDDLVETSQQVHTILFGEEVAKLEQERQGQYFVDDALSPAEAQLLDLVVPINANQLEEPKRKWWELHKLF